MAEMLNESDVCHAVGHIDAKFKMFFQFSNDDTINEQIGIFKSEKCSKYDDFAPCFIYGVKWRKAVVVVVDDDDVGHTMSALLKYHQPYVDEEDLRLTLSYNDK